MKTIYSVEIKDTMYTDDIFNGSFEECVEYIKENEYTKEDNDVRIAKVIIDEDNTIVECVEIITKF